jgi:hypothetical protein
MSDRGVSRSEGDAGLVWGELFIVDHVEMDSENLAAYLQAVQTVAVPVMERHGAQLESCRSSRDDIGPVAEVEVIWRIFDNVTWNRIRRDLVLDPDWYTWGQAAAGLRRGGSRRLMYAAQTGGVA